MRRRYLQWVFCCLPVLLLVYTSMLLGAAPRAFTITGISPNPINPSTGEVTQITYRTSYNAYVTITVSNSGGTVVRTLAKQQRIQSGTRSVSWDGKNSTGQLVPDGNYTVKISGTTTNGASMTAASGSITVSTGPPPAFSFVVLTPTSFDPTIGEGCDIVYTVPCTANCRLVIRDDNWVIVEELHAYAWKEAGSYWAYWDGHDTEGRLVPAGTYTIKLEGVTTTGQEITSCKELLQITIPPGTPLDYGQLVEGAGSANFNWLKDGTTEFSVAFRAPKSGRITQITNQWRMVGDYGGGDRGLFTFELRANGTDNYPSDTIIAVAADIQPLVDGYIEIPISADLVKDTIYHLVVRNTHSDPFANWSSPNTLMTRVRPWDGTGFCCAVKVDGVWKPWSSVWNVYNTSGDNYVNGSHSPLMLTWENPLSYWGDPYWSSAIQSCPAVLYRANKAGQYIVWDRPSVVVRRIGIPVVRVGTPGKLLYHLEKEDGQVLASGTIATAGQVDTKIPTWVYAKLPLIIINKGDKIRLWFDSPTSTSTKNCYIHYPPYGRGELPNWLECGWGGTQSYYITNTGTGWSGMPAFDLTFSLQ